VRQLCRGLVHLVCPQKVGAAASMLAGVVGMTSSQARARAAAVTDLPRTVPALEHGRSA
jgi:hypothetical protein